MVSDGIDSRLEALGIGLSRPTVIPAGARLPFAFVNRSARSATKWMRMPPVTRRG
jgi:hypothetical protein